MESHISLSPPYSSYSDGVYEKLETAPPSQCSAPPSQQQPVERPPVLPRLMLALLVLVLVFCFIGLLVSGLVFGHRVDSDANDSLGQSWVMFSSILGLLYISLHVQAACKGEAIDRDHPCAQHPLHSAALVVARLDAIAWGVSLIIVAVSVSQRPVPVSLVNLVACSALTLAIALILCVDEKAARPFDLPYLTNNGSPPSVVTCRVSDIMADMRDVHVEDSISRRNSYSSQASIRYSSHTLHAAAVAAANPTHTATISGPRPPPSSVKEARPWAFTSFDSKTKRQFAESVVEASQTSDCMSRVGGPRPLAASEIAARTGVLPPPVCLEPKVQRLPEQRPYVARERLQATVEDAPEAGGQEWGGDWTCLANMTGWASAASSTANNTPMPTPNPGLHPPTRVGSRRLSPVVEVDDKRLSQSSSEGGRPATAAPSQAVRPTTRAASQPTTTTTTTTYGQRDYAAAYNATHGPDPTPPARVRLVRAQEALKTPRRKSGTVVLTRAQSRYTGDVGGGRGGGGVAEDQRLLTAAATPGTARPDHRMPGAWEH